MARGIRRLTLATAVAVALSCAPALAASVPSHGYFNSNGTYDCQVFEPAVIGLGGYWNYVNTYKFSSNGTYTESGARVGKQLQPPTFTGRYHLSGNKIIPSSGILKKARNYMVIDKRFLHVAKDNGHLSGLNCLRIYPPPPAPPKVVALAKYSCVQTALTSDGLQTYYMSNLVTSTLTFYNNGTYQPNDLSTTGNWHTSGNKIVFTSGPYWTSGFSPQHNVGIHESPGVTMPHAASPFDPSTLYSLVIRDTRQEGGIPPYQQFTNNDGPSGSYTGDPQSWYYCNKS